MLAHWSTALFAAWLTLQAWLDLRLLRAADAACEPALTDPFIDG